jgi:predicted metal-dependent HD superfamily phosphohydrolase
MIAHFRALFLSREVNIALVETDVSDLYERYSENGRFYHNLIHIEAVLNHIQPCLSQAENPVTLQLAAWFHDVIYDAQRHDNEAQSALFAREFLAKLGFSGDEISEVERLIMLTVGHETSFSDLDGHILLDADLAILAAEPAQYDAYAQAIRQEYVHVPDEAYLVGRGQVLKRLGERPFLYHLPEHQNWEAKARENMQREWTGLTSYQAK